MVVQLVFAFSLTIVFVSLSVMVLRWPTGPGISTGHDWQGAKCKNCGTGTTTSLERCEDMAKTRTGI